MDWLIGNTEWIFSGLGVFLLGVFMRLIRSSAKTQEVIPVSNESGLNNHINIEINENSEVNSKKNSNKAKAPQKRNLDDFKNCTRILFIDDDARFKVVKILSRSGWVHTKLIKDCDALDDRDVVEADILFIDVQGVGVSMGFSDEGLGLALAIKEKYKEKKVIIYSAETEGDRFHEALRKADSFLAKNADPYQFQRLVEEYTIGFSG